MWQSKEKWRRLARLYSSNINRLRVHAAKPANDVEIIYRCWKTTYPLAMLASLSIQVAGSADMEDVKQELKKEEKLHCKLQNTGLMD